MQGDAGRAILDFLGQNQLQKVHAVDGVRLSQHSASTRAIVHGKRLAAAGFRHHRAHRRFLCRRRTPPRPRRNFRRGADHNFPVADLDSRERTGFCSAHRHHCRPLRREICRDSRRLQPPDFDPRRARCEDREPRSRPARSREHQPDARRRVSPRGRNCIHHPAGKRRLHRRPAAQQTYPSLGGQSSLHSRRPNSCAHRQPARLRGRHGHNRQDHPHQSRHRRCLRRRQTSRAPTANSRSNRTERCWRRLRRFT